jgi:hypothetical protein
MRKSRFTEEQIRLAVEQASGSSQSPSPSHISFESIGRSSKCTLRPRGELNSVDTVGSFPYNSANFETRGPRYSFHKSSFPKSMRESRSTS